MPSVMERQQISSTMWQALKTDILRRRQKIKMEQEADAEIARIRKERENKQKQDVMTLEETKEQIVQLEAALSQYRDEKHQLFFQLKKVLNEDETRKRGREPTNADLLSLAHYQSTGLVLNNQSSGLPVSGSRSPLYHIPSSPQQPPPPPPQPQPSVLPVSQQPLLAPVTLKRTHSPSPPPVPVPVVYSTPYNYKPSPTATYISNKPYVGAATAASAPPPPVPSVHVTPHYYPPPPTAQQQPPPPSASLLVSHALPSSHSPLPSRPIVNAVASSALPSPYVPQTTHHANPPSLHPSHYAYAPSQYPTAAVSMSTAVAPPPVAIPITKHTAPPPPAPPSMGGSLPPSHAYHVPHLGVPSTQPNYLHPSAASIPTKPYLDEKYYPIPQHQHTPVGLPSLPRSSASQLHHVHTLTTLQQQQQIKAGSIVSGYPVRSASGITVTSSPVATSAYLTPSNAQQIMYSQPPMGRHVYPGPAAAPPPPSQAPPQPAHYY